MTGDMAMYRQADPFARKSKVKIAGPSHTILSKVRVVREHWVDDGTWYVVRIGEPRSLEADLAAYRDKAQAETVAQVIKELVETPKNRVIPR